MNVLEKILDEIEHEAMTNKEIGRKQCEGMARAMNIIRSRMNKRRNVTSAEIIRRFIDEKPYYGIKYKEIGEADYTIGYGSYNLGYVIDWLNECFEFCGKAKVVVSDEKSKNIHSANDWIPCSERLPEESLNSVIGWDMYRERCVFVQYLNGRWIFGNDTEPVLITAWQPLPEPYKPVETKPAKNTQQEIEDFWRDK